MRGMTGRAEHATTLKRCENGFLLGVALLDRFTLSEELRCWRRLLGFSIILVRISLSLPRDVLTFFRFQLLGISSWAHINTFRIYPFNFGKNATIYSKRRF
jgi:hypothetical protein